jgi:hypothetical protein
MRRAGRLDRLEQTFTTEAHPPLGPEENVAWVRRLIEEAAFNTGAMIELMEVLDAIDRGDPDADEMALRLALRCADVREHPSDDRVTAPEARRLLRLWEGARGGLPARVWTADGMVEFEGVKASPEEITDALRAFDPDDERSVRLGKLVGRLRTVFGPWHSPDCPCWVNLHTGPPDPRVEAMVARLAGLIEEAERRKRR